MSEWGVFLVIVALIGFVSAIVAPLLKLNTAIVSLIDSVDALNKSFDELTKSNTSTHKRIWDRLEGHEQKINDHETRLKLIEDKKER